MKQLLTRNLDQRSVPPLRSGDRLNRVEFTKRYQLHPNIKAELVEGVVYVASPVFLPHARLHAYVMGLISQYVMQTQGLDLADNLSVRLDNENEVQPDVCVWFSANESVRNLEQQYFEGAPEFAFEIAASSAAYDLHDKLDVYQRNAVQEYVVLSVYDQGVHWFVRHDGAFRRIAANEEGVFKSELLSGFWFDAEAFWREDWAQVLGTLQAGMNSAEYATFKQSLSD